MTGALMATLGGGSGSGGSGTPGAVSWSNVYATSGGATNFETLSGITGAITVAASNSGASQLGYTLNGVNYTYTGAFAWPEGQSLGWYLIGAGAGTVAVTYDGGTALASFTYSITNARSGGFSP
ncbi:MAG: hypothetical protein KGL69_11080 [Alphaproteobacteria bacterium]|nr:hypothetical protein [Alphaproteobacteria bacterium]